MIVTIRLADELDRDAVLDLAARAWEPVFESVNGILGPELAKPLHGDDWRVYHAAEVHDILTAEAAVAWVAEIGGRIVGFAAARVVDPLRRVGEVWIVSMDPTAQRTGVGSALTRHAEAWLRAEGMAVAFIGTGGDPGRRPAASCTRRSAIARSLSSSITRRLARRTEPEGSCHHFVERERRIQ